MSNNNNVDINESNLTPHYSEFARVVRVFFRRRLALVGFCIIILLIILAIFAPLIAPYDPDRISPTEKLQQPDTNHLLGTDQFGRDTLSRIIFGARISLVVSILSVGIGATVGMLLGLIAAYFSGWVNSLIMRAIDAIMCVPPLLVALVIATALGGGITNVIIALSIGVIPGQARLMCAQSLSVKQNDYILLAKAKGMNDLRLMFKHIVPNAFPPLLVLITVELGAVILTEASLSFLGIGINPPTAAWGSMVNDGYPYLLNTPVLSFAPGIAIMLVVFGFQMMGDGLRDALDPRLRGSI